MTFNPEGSTIQAQLLTLREKIVDRSLDSRKDALEYLDMIIRQRPKGWLLSPPITITHLPDLSKRHPKSQRFHEILRELGELHDRKQRDYGSDNDPFANVSASKDWGIEPHVGALLRMNDKVQRLKQWIKTGTLANEGAHDSMRDIAVYAIIALVLNEWEKRLDLDIPDSAVVPPTI